MIDHSPAYRCKVVRPNTKAWLKLGVKRRVVDVIEMSRESFTVRLSKKLAKRISVGGRFRLFYQEMLWSVLCKQKWINNEGHVDIEFQPLEELTQPALPKASLFSSTRTVSASGGIDGTLAMMILATLVLAVLIMPAWGGKWGTSQVICDGVTIVWNALRSLVTGRTY